MPTWQFLPTADCDDEDVRWIKAPNIQIATKYVESTRPKPGYILTPMGDYADDYDFNDGVDVILGENEIPQKPPMPSRRGGDLTNYGD